MTMRPITTCILGELAQVGRAPVVVKVNSRLFSPELVRACAFRCGGDLSTDDTGEVSVAPTGRQAREALRRFTNELLAATLEHE